MLSSRGKMLAELGRPAVSADQISFCSFCPRRANKKTKKYCHQCRTPICPSHTVFACGDCSQEPNMVRHYVKKSSRGTCCKDSLATAMEMVREGIMKILKKIDNVKGDQRTTELTFDEDCSESERNSPCCTLPQPPAKKLKEADQVERQNELLKLACDLLSTSSKPEESNEFLDIGKVWGTKLMSLDPMQRKFAEKAINEILFEADLGTLHRDSVKINHNPNSDPFESI